MTTNPPYARPENVAAARSGDGALFVMALPDGLPRALNGAADAIWEVAVSGTAHVVEEVAEAFEIAPETIAVDVADTLAFLVRAGLLEPAAGGSS